MRPEIEEWIQRQLAAAPPLSQATRNRLAALLAANSRQPRDGLANPHDEAA